MPNSLFYLNKGSQWSVLQLLVKMHGSRWFYRRSVLCEAFSTRPYAFLDSIVTVSLDAKKPNELKMQKNDIPKSTFFFLNLPISWLADSHFFEYGLTNHMPRQLSHPDCTAFAQEPDLEHSIMSAWIVHTEGNITNFPESVKVFFHCAAISFLFKSIETYKWFFGGAL